MATVMARTATTAPAMSAIVDHGVWLVADGFAAAAVVLGNAM